MFLDLTKEQRKTVIPLNIMSSLSWSSDINKCTGKLSKLGNLINFKER